MNNNTHHDAIIEADLNADGGSERAVEIIRDGGGWPGDMRAAEALIRDAVEIAVVLAKSANLIAPAIALTKSDPHMNIVLSSDQTMRRLNHQFRGKDQPTNVLSFPVGDDSAFGPVANMVIGDVVMGFETVAAEARARKIPLDHHVTHLAVHGALHLLGLDHEHEAEAQKMEELETIVLARVDIPDPHETGTPVNQSSQLASGE